MAFQLGVTSEHSSLQQVFLEMSVIVSYPLCVSDKTEPHILHLHSYVKYYTQMESRTSPQEERLVL